MCVNALLSEYEKADYGMMGAFNRTGVKMRSLPRLWLLLFILLPLRGWCGQAPAASDPPDKKNATVAGKVLRLDTGEPLKKARVTLQSNGKPDFSVLSVTDEQGQFIFENIAPGAYELEVSRDGYIDTEYGQKRPGTAGAILALTSGQSVTDLVFKLARTAAISGHVFDEDGEPLARAEVKTYRASRKPGHERENYDDHVLTNDLGEFRIFDLSPGRYYVAVNFRHEDFFGRAPPPPAQGFAMGYAPSYYPNTIDPAKAQVISVGPGDDIRPVDFFLHASRFFTVRGRVICAIPGNSEASRQVSLYPQGPGLAQALGGIVDKFQLKDGSFVLRNVPPGSYDLFASYRNGETNERLIARRPLEVANSDVDGVTITISRGMDISGRLTWEGAAPNDAGDLHIILQPLGEAEPFLAYSVLRPDGAFLFKNVPEGSYRPVVQMSAPVKNFFLKSARYGSATISDAGFTVQNGSDLAVELTLSSRVAQLSGVVLDTDSLPAAGATVVLIPDPPHRGMTEHFKSMTTDQNGRFSLSGITPGDYKVFSWDVGDDSDELYGADWFDAEWLKAYETKGEAVHLGEAEQKSVNLVLIQTRNESHGSN
jgi:hypothetical protein